MIAIEWDVSSCTRMATMAPAVMTSSWYSYSVAGDPGIRSCGSEERRVMASCAVRMEDAASIDDRASDALPRSSPFR